MKTTLLVLFCCFFVSLAAGQKIHLTDSTNTWTVLHYHEGLSGNYVADNYQLSFAGDTVVRGKAYKKMVPLYSTLAYYGNFYRDDTIADKVWCMHLPAYSNDYDTLEHLIYNGHWQTGDTIVSIYGNSLITGRDSVSINGQWYSKFHVVTPNATHRNWDIMEGIGATGGPAFTAKPYTFEDEWQLKCFRNRGSQPSVSPPINAFGVFFDNDLSCALDVSKPLMANQATIYPNPARDAFVIKNISGLKGGSATLYNATGMQLLSQNINNSELKFNTAGYAAGVYFIRLQAESVRQAFRLILQH